MVTGIIVFRSLAKTLKKWPSRGSPWGEQESPQPACDQSAGPSDQSAVPVHVTTFALVECHQIVLALKASQKHYLIQVFLNNRSIQYITEIWSCHLSSYSGVVAQRFLMDRWHVSQRYSAAAAIRQVGSHFGEGWPWHQGISRIARPDTVAASSMWPFKRKLI